MNEDITYIIIMLMIYIISITCLLQLLYYRYLQAKIWPVMSNWN